MVLLFIYEGELFTNEVNNHNGRSREMYSVCNCIIYGNCNSFLPRFLLIFICGKAWKIITLIDFSSQGSQLLLAKLLDTHSKLQSRLKCNTTHNRLEIDNYSRDLTFCWVLGSI